VRVGAFEVMALVDGEGSFATVGEAFPALDAPEPWRLPVNAVLIRGAGHFHGPGRFGRNGGGFSWSSLAKEGGAAVE
jgi:hypothetical protein